MLSTSALEKAARDRYERSLKKKYFQAIKTAMFEAQIDPMSKGVMVAACFHWMCLSLDTYKSASLFPMYAAVERDGRESTKFTSRIRDYMINKFHIPVRKFPLFIHAIALFDAYQLMKTFFAWKNYVSYCSKLDAFANKLRTRRFMRKWERTVFRKLFLKNRSQRLQSIRVQRSLKRHMVTWHIVFKGRAFERLCTVPRKKMNILYALRITLNLNKFERISVDNGARFFSKRLLIRSCRHWITKLCRVTVATLFGGASSDHNPLSLLCALLLEVIRRNYVRSLHYSEVVRSVASSRSHFYRYHPLVFHLVKSIYRNMPTNIKDLYRNNADENLYHDQQQQQQYHQRFSPSHSPVSVRREPLSRGRNHSPSFDGEDFDDSFQLPSPISVLEPPVTFHTPESTRPPNRRNHNDSARHHNSRGDQHVRFRSKSVERHMVVEDLESSVADKYNCAAIHNSIYHSSLALLRQNLGSRVTQQTLCGVADQYAHLRGLATALRRWMTRIPQLKLDRMSSDTTVLFASNRSGTDQEVNGYYFILLKKLRFGLHRWRSNSKRSVTLCRNYYFVKNRSEAATRLRLFGLWLVSVAKREQIRRAENRVICNRLNKLQYLSFYAWCTLLHRTVLMRNNRRQEVLERNQAIKQFVAEKHKQDSARSLRIWSLHIRDRKRGRLLNSLWYKIVGRKFLRLALHKWRLILNLDTIVTCFKKIWLGYKARKILHREKYFYLQWFRPQISKYRHFRSFHAKRVVFDILSRYLLLLKSSWVAETALVRCRRAVKWFKKYKSKVKFCRKMAAISSKNYARHAKQLTLQAFRASVVTARRLAALTDTSTAKKLKDYFSRLRMATRLSTQLSMVASKSNRALCALAMNRFRAWHKYIFKRYLRNREAVRHHKLRQGMRHLAAFRDRRQSVASFQEYQLRKSARRILAQWLLTVQIRNRQYIISRLHFKKFGARKLLRHWWRHTQRYLYGQLQQSAFHATSRKRLLQRVENKRVQSALRVWMRATYSHRKQRALVRYTGNVTDKRGIKHAFDRIKFNWYHKHRSKRTSGRQFSHRGSGDGHSNISHMTHVRLRNIDSSIRRGMLHAGLVALMRRNLSRSFDDNRLSRALSKWASRHRLHSKAARTDERNLRLHLHHVLKRYLLKLTKNVIRRKKKRHWLQQEKKLARKQKMVDFIRLLYKRHRRRVQNYNSILLFNQQRALYVYSKCIFWLRRMCRFGGRFRAKPLLRRYVRRLLHMGRLFFAILRKRLTRRKRSPALKAIVRLTRKRMRMALKRFRLRCKQVNSSCAIQRHISIYCARSKALTLLRYWRRLVFLKKRLAAIRKRFVLIPKLKLWVSQTRCVIKHARIEQHMGKKMNRRVKMDVMYLWKLFTVRESRLRMQTELVQKLIVRRRKAGVLYMWMRIMDDKEINKKYQKTRLLHARHVQKRAFLFWHKQYLVSYLSTWKSAKATFRNWVSRTYWQNRQRALTAGAIIVHDRKVARRFLMTWYFETRRVTSYRRKRQVGRKKVSVKKFLKWFRRWQWRLAITKYCKHFCYYPHHRSSETFNKHRAVRKWLRFTRFSAKRNRKKRLTTTLTAWRKHTHAMKYARQAFLSRLREFKVKHTLSYFFGRLLGNCKDLQAQRMWRHMFRLMHTSKVFDFWKRLYARRMSEKRKVANSMLGIYKVQKYRLFRIWKLKTTCGFRLNRIELKTYAWKKWRALLAARRHWRAFKSKLVFLAWKTHLYSIDAHKRLLLRQRRRVWTLVTRKMRDHLLILLMAFKRWRTGDHTIHLRDFHRNGYLLKDHAKTMASTSTAGNAGSVHAHLRTVELYHQLGHSQAGQGLLSAAHLLQRSAHNLHSHAPRHPTPSRLLAIQSNFEKRLVGATGSDVSKMLGGLPPDNARLAREHARLEAPGTLNNRPHSPDPQTPQSIPQSHQKLHPNKNSMSSLLATRREVAPTPDSVIRYSPTQLKSRGAGLSANDLSK